MPTSNVALIKTLSSVSLDAMVARFLASAFGMVAERATLLRSKVAQQNSGVSSALSKYRSWHCSLIFSVMH